MVLQWIFGSLKCIVTAITNKHFETAVLGKSQLLGSAPYPNLATASVSREMCNKFQFATSIGRITCPSFNSTSTMVDRWAEILWLMSGFFSLSLIAFIFQ